MAARHNLLLSFDRQTFTFVAVTLDKWLAVSNRVERSLWGSTGVCVCVRRVDQTCQTWWGKKEKFGTICGVGECDANL